jgi:hypothetical protein
MKTQTKQNKVMKTLEKLQEIKNRYRVGDEIAPGFTVDKIGSKYITVLSIWDYTHTVKYTVEEFYHYFIR